VVIEETDKIEKLFLNKTRSLKPRDQRDVGRVMNLIKAITLLNAYTRKSVGRDVIADKKDIKWAIKIWKKVSEAQELNLPPYVYDLYKKVIVAKYKEKGSAITRKEIMTKHYEVYRRFLPDRQLRLEISPMLDTSGLITEEKADDKRTILITPTKTDYPTPGGTTSPNSKNKQETKDPIIEAKQIFDID